MTALETLFAIKLLYSAFMAVLIPVYLYRYGWTNFLYFCDLALLLALAGLWLDDPLPISMSAVGILLPQTLWVADYIFNLFGLRTTGLTNYMFESHRSRFLRGLSLFHGWLPFLLLYLVWEMGYDGRAFVAWTALSCVVLPICYFLMPKAQPDPGMTPVNINLVWGFVVCIAVLRPAGRGLLADASAAAVFVQAGGVIAPPRNATLVNVPSPLEGEGCE